jgi:hypothetical protein
MFHYSQKSKELTLDHNIYITKLKPHIIRSLIESFVAGDPGFAGSFSTGRMAGQFQIHGFNQSGMIVFTQCNIEKLQLLMIDYRLGDKELVQYLVRKLGPAIVEHKGTESKQDIMDFCESAAKYFERLQQRQSYDPSVYVTESAIESARECGFQDFNLLSVAIGETIPVRLALMHCPHSTEKYAKALNAYKADPAYCKTILFKDEKVFLDQVVQVKTKDGELVLSVHFKWDLEECQMIIGWVTEHYNFDF